MEPAESPKVEKIEGIDKYEVEGAADTLVRAEEIKQQPPLLAAAKKVIAKRLEAMQAIE